MRVLITGSSGFIGTNLGPVLKNYGYEIVGIDLNPPRRDELLEEFVKCDVRDSSAVSKVLEEFKPISVVHLAARTDVVNSPTLEEYSTNTEGVRAVLNAVQTSSVERAVFASSRLVFSPVAQPRAPFDYSADTDYGRSKVIGEQLVRSISADDKSRSYVIARPTSIWGPEFSLPYAQFFNVIASGRYFKPGKSRIFKSFGYVDNVCHQLAGLLDGRADNLHSPVWLTDLEPIEIGDFADRISAKLGRQGIRTAPLSVLKVGALVGDALAYLGLELRFPLTSARLRNMTTDTVYDTSVERDLYSDLPYVQLDEAISRTLQFLRARV